MLYHKQAEISRLMTGSNITDEQLFQNVTETHKILKEEACRQVDILLQKHNMPFDKGFPILKSDFILIAEKYDLDSAALFWIYMEWRNKKNGK